MASAPEHLYRTTGKDRWEAMQIDQIDQMAPSIKLLGKQTKAIGLTRGQQTQEEQRTKSISCKYKKIKRM